MTTSPAPQVIDQVAGRDARDRSLVGGARGIAIVLAVLSEGIGVIMLVAGSPIGWVGIVSGFGWIIAAAALAALAVLFDLRTEARRTNRLLEELVRR